MKKITMLLLVLTGFNTRSQQPFNQVDQWLAEQVSSIGGRLMLVVSKDGKTVYSQTVNNMSGKDKMLVRLVAQKQGKPADFSSYTSSTQQPIASCSKWLSEALVMTFVDEGKLMLTDTVGQFFSYCLNIKRDRSPSVNACRICGGAISTADDYMNFLVMILNKGEFHGKHVLSEGSIAQMQLKKISPAV